MCVPRLLCVCVLCLSSGLSLLSSAMKKLTGAIEVFKQGSKVYYTIMMCVCVCVCASTLKKLTAAIEVFTQGSKVYLTIIMCACVFVFWIESMT
jgi:hypothetical protein